MNPVTRQEMFLNAAAGNEQALPAPVAREEVFLKAIVDAQSSGGGLPSVSDTDNGKVLTVVDGVWSPAAGGSSGSGVLVVHVDENTGAFDKTWQEIHDAPFAVIYEAGDNESSSIQIFSTGKNVSNYEVHLLGRSNSSPAFFTAVADSASGYPVFQE